MHRVSICPTLECSSQKSAIAQPVGASPKTRLAVDGGSDGAERSNLSLNKRSHPGRTSCQKPSHEENHVVNSQLHATDKGGGSWGPGHPFLAEFVLYY